MITYGPLTVGVNGSDPNFLWAGKSGEILCSASVYINHAVLLVGYNETHWFVKNSWGTAWGDQGFGYISKFSDCNIRTKVTEMQVDFGFNAAPSNNAIKISIILNTLGSGWTGSGNVLAIKQNNITVGTFGNKFYLGRLFGPVYIWIVPNIEAQIVVSKLGVKTNEIGFVVKNPNGTVMYERKAGATFNASTVFYKFKMSGVSSMGPGQAFEEQEQKIENRADQVDHYAQV